MSDLLARGLTKVYNKRKVVNQIDLSISPGEVVGLLGPNGAGKTTFLRILSSLSRPTFGKVSISGYRLPNQATEVRKNWVWFLTSPYCNGDLSAERKFKILWKALCGARNFSKGSILF